MPDRDTVMRHETWRDMETRDRAKTRHTSVETEPRPWKPRLEKVSRQDTDLETPSLHIRGSRSTRRRGQTTSKKTWCPKYKMSKVNQ